MISRIMTAVCLLVTQPLLAGDQRSDLKLTAVRRQPGGAAWFVISAAAHKRVLVSIKETRVKALDVSAEFPYSVTLTESPTPRYTAVLVFSAREKDMVVDSFGVTSGDAGERTDAETHRRVLDGEAEGRAIAEKLAKDIWGEHH